MSIDENKELENEISNNEELNNEESGNESIDNLEAETVSEDDFGEAPTPPVRAKAFVESSTRADDMKSSGVAFFIVGILLIAVALFIYLGILPIGTSDFQKTLNACIVLLFAIAFFAVSVYSTRRAKILNEKSRSEEKLTEEIIQYCVNNYVEPVLENADELDNLAEETYFAREQFLRQMITTEYKGLTESYIDYLLDLVYSELFEENEE